MNEEVPRDPSYFSPTVHCIQRKKDRNIKWPDVAETIQKGTLKNATGRNVYLFVHEKEEYENPLGVVVNSAEGDIVTVEYRYD